MCAWRPSLAWTHPVAASCPTSRPAAPAVCGAAAARPPRPGSGSTRGCAWSGWGRAASYAGEGWGAWAVHSNRREECTAAGAPGRHERGPRATAAACEACTTTRAFITRLGCSMQRRLPAQRSLHAHLATRRYEALCVAVRMRKWVTPSGPATCTKSLSWLRLLSLSAVAVLGAISCAGRGRGRAGPLRRGAQRGRRHPGRHRRGGKQAAAGSTASCRSSAHCLRHEQTHQRADTEHGPLRTHG